MKNIKEPHAFHTHHPRWSESTEVRLRFRQLSRKHLPNFRIVLRLRRAARALAFLGRNFGNHGAGNVIGIGQHQVKVAVTVLASLLLPAEQDTLYGIDLFLSVGAFVAQDLRGARRHQLRNAGIPRRKVDASGVIIKDGLDAPALSPAMDAAGELRRRSLAEVTQQQERRDDQYQEYKPQLLRSFLWH